MANDELKSFLKSFRKEIGKALQSVNEKISGLQQDVSGLKQDVLGLKEDVGVLKQDVSGLKEDVSELKEDARGIRKVVVRLQEDMNQVKDSLETNTASLISIETKLDGYGDMYKINEDHIQMLNKRMIKFEGHLEIEPPQNLLIPTK